MANPTADWTALISRYYDGCSAGDVDLMLTTLHPGVVHWFLAPNTGSQAVEGAEHLARYWRKVTGMLHARWVVDSICATPEQGSSSGPCGGSPKARASASPRAARSGSPASTG